MPVYEFRCPKCLENEEVLLPMGNRNDPISHSCGAVMDRLISLPSVAVFKIYSKGQILDTLNTEAKHPIRDGVPVRSKRSQDALYRGLDYVRPLEEKVFTGF